MSNDKRTEVENATVEPGFRPGVTVYMSAPLHAKVLAFAVEYGIEEVGTRIEGLALAIIAARYFRMIEDDRWASWAPRETP